MPFLHLSKQSYPGYYMLLHLLGILHGRIEGNVLRQVVSEPGLQVTTKMIILIFFQLCPNADVFLLLGFEALA